MKDTDNSNEHRNRGEKGELHVESHLHRVFTPLYCYSQPKDLLDKNQHEICDHLVCWGDTLIIISEKNWTFTGDHEQYHKKTVESAVAQIQGAERKLLNFPRDIEIEHPYYGRHRFPRENFSKVIRLVVNLGEGEEFYPLARETNRSAFVSVINRDTLDVMLSELDTPKDLLQYLSEREKLLQVTNEHGKRGLILSGREVDLLSLYLKNGREFPSQLYDKEFTMISLDVDGSWEEFRRRLEVVARADANYDSYFIDELVHREILSLTACEPIVRLLMTFSRIERRAIGNAFSEAARKFSELANPGYTFRRELPFGNRTIICLFYHSSLSPETREGLVRLALYGTAIHNKYAMKEALVIGTSETGDQFHFDYNPDITPFDPDDEQEMISAVKSLHWFTDLQPREVRFNEYPMPSSDGHSFLRIANEILSWIRKKFSLFSSEAKLP